MMRRRSFICLVGLMALSTQSVFATNNVPLAELPVTGQPVVLVTHQVTINAFTDAGVPSGGGSIFQLTGSVSRRWLGSIPAPWLEQGRLP